MDDPSTDTAQLVAHLRRELVAASVRAGETDLARTRQERDLIDEIAQRDPTLLARRTPAAVAAAIVYTNELARRRRGDGRDTTLTQANVAAVFDVSAAAVQDPSSRMRKLLSHHGRANEPMVTALLGDLLARLQSSNDVEAAVLTMIDAISPFEFEQPSNDPRERARRRRRGAPRATGSTSELSLLRIKLTLRDVRPPVWRRVEVASTTTLDRLHQVIQAAMGWENCHLHEFNDDEFAYSSIDPEFVDAIDSRTVTIGELAGVGDRLSYWYDLGDDWWHDVTLDEQTVDLRHRQPSPSDRSSNTTGSAHTSDPSAPRTGAQPDLR